MGVAFVFQELPPFGEKYLHEIVSAMKILALTGLAVKHIWITIPAKRGGFLLVERFANPIRRDLKSTFCCYRIDVEQNHQYCNLDLKS